jgi:phage recombination protein Bet
VNEVAVQHKNEVSAKIAREYFASFGLAKNLSDEEKAQFINIASTWELNPFKREIHIVAYGKGEYRQFSIMVGYEVYIKRAERSGKLKWWKAWTEGSGTDLVAKVQILRSDWDKPFEHEVYFEECAQYKKEKDTEVLNKFWKKQPRFMLKKVAISQAFRLCFCDENGGLPYEEAELPTMRDVTELQDQKPEPQPRQEPERKAFDLDAVIAWFERNGVPVAEIERRLGRPVNTLTEKEAHKILDDIEAERQAAAMAKQAEQE